MQDGKGALYFIKPQATQKTRQQMREDSPSGIVHMRKSKGRRLTSRVLVVIAVIGTAALAAINSILPPGW